MSDDGPIVRLGPNTSGLLKRWGLVAKPAKAVNITQVRIESLASWRWRDTFMRRADRGQVTEYNKDGSLKNEKDASGLGNIYQHVSLVQARRSLSVLRSDL